jgi:glutathione peroxidase-family protein|tara:strand:- start:785 stop:934 length:150 start_codon:yes stop_codon:yes gene_type:complete
MRFNLHKCKTGKSNSTIFDFTVTDLDNKNVSLEKYRLNNPIIVVNVASL